MSEVWLFDGALVCLLVWAPVSRMSRTFPRLAPDSDGQPPSADAVQKSYLRRARVTTTLAIAIPLAAMYLWFRLASYDHASDQGDNPLLTWLVLVGALAIGHSASVIWVRIAAVRLVAARPEFAESLDRGWMSALSALVVVLPLALLTGGFLVGGDFGVPVGIFSAIAAHTLLLRLITRMVVRRQAPIDPESALGVSIREMLQKAGVEPKRLVRIRSFMANGYALRDGTIAVTTMLAAICTEPEVAAVLAHELSHSVDGDPRRLRRLAMVVALSFFAGCAVFGFFLGSYNPSGPYLIPAIVFTMIACLRPLMFLIQRTSRRLEFKCDAYTARLGYGRELASGLIKLHRVMGIPNRWAGVDRFTLTHPSLDDRIQALELRAAAAESGPGR